MKFQHRGRVIWPLVFLLVLPLGLHKIQALVVGSNTTPSRESHATFPAADSDNTLLGVAAFVNGFSLEDNTTTCTYDNFFPVSGVINLNAGKLFLQKDLVLSNTFGIGNPGQIYGNNFALVVGKQLDEVIIPVASNAFSSKTIATATMNADVQSVDWSFDDQYVAAISLDAGGSHELEIYYFDGMSLTLTQSRDLERNGNTVRWHPSKHFLAYGRHGVSNHELFVYKLNVSNGLFGGTDTRDFGNKPVRATAWHPSGNYLAAGTDQNSGEISLYAFDQNTGLLSDITPFDLNPNRQVGRDALSWSPGGSHFAIGTEKNTSSNGEELLVCSFNGSSMTLTASFNFNNNVNSVDWSPTGTYIAVALDSSSENIRIFQHQLGPEKVVEVQAARVGETSSVASVHWDDTGTYLLVGIDAGVSSAMRVYSFDSNSGTLTLLNSVASSSDVNTARFSQTNSYIARGNGADQVIVSSFKKIVFTVFDLELVLNTDTKFITDVYWSGTCKINGQGKRLTIGSDAKFFIRPGAHITMQDVELNGLSQGNFVCMADDCDIVFKDSIVTLTSDYTFSHGSFLCSGDVCFTGTSAFTYATKRTSTIELLTTCKIDRNTTFSYDPNIARSDLLYFDGDTAQLYLNGCTVHATKTGLQLEGGSLVIDDKVTFSSQGRALSEAIVLKNDLSINVLGGATLDLFGLVMYE
ncbi:MAG: WD40 repeat domain-containing protein [Epsilonproteobacteria bacterium]|nr:WD40 repeat domain-containing protein [Campylobacterota bacterium]